MVIISKRIHFCSECGYEQNRDIAAAEVIRNRGLNAAVGAPVVKRTSAVLDSRLQALEMNSRDSGSAFPHSLFVQETAL